MASGAAIPADVLAVMKEYGLGSDEIWQVHGTAWVIKHKALERVAIERGIVFDQPHVIEGNSADKIVALVVTGTMDKRTEWSIGEAAPNNNKNQYPYAMAEKRGKDRVILKLLKAHGMVYSEDEADDFSDTGKRHTTLPKKDARGIYEKLQGEVRNATRRPDFKRWMTDNAERIQTLPEDWQDILRLQCQEMMVDLQQRESAPQKAVDASTSPQPAPQHKGKERASTAAPTRLEGQLLSSLCLEDPEGFLSHCDQKMQEQKSVDDLTNLYNDTLEPAADLGKLFPPDKQALIKMFERHERRLQAN